MKFPYILALSILVVGCSSKSEEANAEEPAFGRYVCTTSMADFATPWVDKDGVFTGGNCVNGAICWWQKTERRVENVRHIHFYIPEPGAVCHYEKAVGRKPID